jgi:hypothetical protein
MLEFPTPPRGPQAVEPALSKRSYHSGNGRAAQQGRGATVKFQSIFAAERLRSRDNGDLGSIGARFGRFMNEM